MSQSDLKKVVFDFLDSHKKAVFASVDADGQPHTNLMLYAIDDNLNLYFGTRRSYGKYSRILQNPSLSITIAEEKLDPLRTVDIHGKAEEVPETDTLATLAYLKGKNLSKYYVQGEPDFVMFKVVPTMIRYQDATLGELTIQHLEV